MRILHIGLLSHYTKGMTYQDNIIPDINCRDGHEVTYISDVFVYKEGKLVDIGEEDIRLSSNLHLIRFNYDFIINSFITNKIQKVSKLKKYIYEYKPDVILYHGLCGYELVTISQYIKHYSQTILYVDSHEDFNNTAQTLISKIAYKYIHGYFIRRALPYIKSVLYISLETKEFIKKMYKISDTKLKWYPLGGIIHTMEERKDSRERLLSRFCFSENTIILSHSGKMNIGKKTRELLEAFNEISDDRFKLFLFGSIPNECEHTLNSLIEKNKNIIFLGWLNDIGLKEVLLASDMYCQPGTQSATMQMAMCCGCAMMVYPHTSYKPYIDKNGYFVSQKEDIEKVFKEIGLEPNKLCDMSKQSLLFSEKNLDYLKLARLIYE